MAVAIHHNPDCGTSRNVLAIIRAAGVEPVVIDYLQTGWTAPQLQGLFAAADLTPRTALRTTKSPAEDLGLLADGVSEDAIFPTNIPDGRRNRNWQHVAPGHVLGATPGTLPLSFLLFDPTGGDDKAGIVGAGVLSRDQLRERGFALPPRFAAFDAGVILLDVDGDGALDPAADRIIGGVRQRGPAGAAGAFPTTPLVDGRPLLSQPTARVDPQVGPQVGGAVMDVLYKVGDARGDYAIEFGLLTDFDDAAAVIGDAYTYHVKAK